MNYFIFTWLIFLVSSLPASFSHWTSFFRLNSPACLTDLATKISYYYANPPVYSSDQVKSSYYQSFGPNDTARPLSTSFQNTSMYDKSLIYAMGEAASLPYCSQNQQSKFQTNDILRIGNFTILKEAPPDANGNSYIIIQNKDLNYTILIFRGTVTREQDLNNLNAGGMNPSGIFSNSPSGSEVHEGFYNEFQGLIKNIDNDLQDLINSSQLDSSFYILGHSLGGAFAFLAASYYSEFPRKSPNGTIISIEALYTIGQPKVGNQVFVNYYSTLIGTDKIVRIVNANDWVPHFGLVPNGVHASKVNEVFMPKGQVDAVICNGANDPNCSTQFSCYQLSPVPHSFLGPMNIGSSFCKLENLVK